MKEKKKRKATRRAEDQSWTPQESKDGDGISDPELEQLISGLSEKVKQETNLTMISLSKTMQI